ncbi:MAG: Fe-S cluster assembly protein SufD [SAR202 cluster bacterium]|nr:Fe-S cluster assembly protein SufD [SAR202 cluster bacterium]
MAASCAPAAKSWRSNWKSEATTGSSRKLHRSPIDHRKARFATRRRIRSIQQAKGTMTQASTANQRYERQFSDFVGGNSTPDWLNTLRRKGMEGFARQGFPTARRGNEAWKYTNVAPIADASFDHGAGATSGLALDALKQVAPWDDAWTTLVFLNGRYSAQLSSPSTGGPSQAGNLAALVRSNGTSVQARLGSLVDIGEDGFAALNTAFTDDGAFVHVPDEVSLEAPVHLLFVSTEGDRPFVTYPRVLVVAGKKSRATIIESYVDIGQAEYFTDSVAEIVVEEEAEVEHYRLLNESDSAFHVGVARIEQKDGSSFSSRAFYNSVALGRHDLGLTINGSECYSDLSGLYVTSGAQHVDNFVNIDHTKPFSTSRLYYKGILSGRSRAVFGGTVYVREGAIKTDALQSDKNLLLSPDAEIDTKPALFIWADDVKCGHGATAGSVNADALFYMRSRGVDLETASKLIIFGFATEIIDTVRVPGLKDFLEKTVLESLPAHRFEF